jgi:release factor glutamine methyltransferase
VLIPRPETEFVVIGALDWLRARPQSDQPVRIADVGTGSGIIAVCLAKHAPTCQVTAIDISPAALEVARLNAAEHGVAERIKFATGDLFDAVPAGQTFDLVVSNPPYITSAEMQELAKDVREYEPRQALEAGPQGTEVIARLIPQAAERLNPGGKLLIEISPQFERPVRALVESDVRFQLSSTIKDLAGLPRVIQAELTK